MSADMFDEYVYIYESLKCIKVTGRFHKPLCFLLLFPMFWLRNECFTSILSFLMKFKFAPTSKALYMYLETSDFG